MRWIVALLLLGSAAQANAEARLRLAADRAVVIVVNMAPHPMTGAGYEEIVIDIADGKEGLQNVRVLNALGKEQWKGTVLVKAGTVVKARWKGRKFEVYDRKTLNNRYGSSKRPAPQAVAGHKGLEALAATTPSVSAEDEVLAAIAEAHATTEDTDASSEEPSDASPDVAPPVVAGQAGKLELVNRTSSWANAWVDGALAHEFRGKGNSVTLDLPTGEHQVQFRDFQDKEDWGHGTVLVYGDIAVQLHFSKAEPPEALNRKEAWTAE